MKLNEKDYCLADPKQDSIFYYVFVPGTGEPTEKHYSYQHAKYEALRIAKKTGKETFILQAHKSYKVSEIVETNFVQEPNRNKKTKYSVYAQFCDYIDNQAI